MTDSYSLKSVLDLPVPFRSAFSFRYFNSLQSECFPLCFHSDINMVISAPTGSGKTVLFELCFLRLLSRSISSGGNFIHSKGTLKTIYISPAKALVQEKLRDWSQKFGTWGINCLELTGDNETYNLRDIQEADIILTTPEKFDAVSRYRITSGGLSFFSDIALLLIDEVHLLNDPRGACLEAIVSRIKMLSNNPDLKSSALAGVRLIAVSATIPNIEDLAEWLKVPVQGIKRFGEEMRPVKLTTKVFGYAAAKNDFLFEKRLQNYIFDILMQYSRGKSALVFCSTRKGAQEAAQRLSQVVMTYGYSNPFIKSKEQLERLREASLSCSDKQLQSYIVYGVGYHNGGLCQKDRSLIEGLFLNGDVHILCTTNTLAHGINLPAHTVVIKSTQHFNKEKGLYMEYDRSTILQMCGRAGRPPFDDTGMVIIMTRRETAHLYENLLNGCELVESQLLPCVTEHLTAEVVQLTVSDITRAIEWIRCSYLYVRMKKNPESYAVMKGLSKDNIEKHLQEVCVQKINELSRYQMIWTDVDGFELKPQEPGKLMTKYYLKFDTMKYIMHAPGNYSLEDAVRVVCQAEEIAWIQLRRNEKKVLNDINIDKAGRLLFHINDEKGKRKKRIQTREEKAFVLVNDCLTGDPSIHDLSMTQDANSICSTGCRIARCMKEYFLYKKNYRGVLNSTLLAKSLYQKLWKDCPYLLKQLPGIGMVTAKALHSMGVKSFDALAEADPRRIEIVTGRRYPFGNHIKESLQSLPPKVKMEVEEIGRQKKGNPKLLVTLTRLSGPVQSSKRHYADMIVSTEEDNLIHFHEKIRVDEFLSPYSTTVLLSKTQQAKLTVKADLLFEEYIGIDLHHSLLLEKENCAKENYRRGTERPHYYLSPKDVFVTKIDDQTKTTGAAQKHQNSLNINGDSTSIPSFQLIDEDSREDVPSPTNEEDDCIILSDQTVFDHIREKAKGFPSVSTLSSGFSPTSESPGKKRKHPEENSIELQTESNDLKTLMRSRNQPKSLLGMSSEPREEEHSRRVLCHNLMREQVSSGIKDSVNLLETGLVCEPDERKHETFTEETIFDHIRKKSKNFPAINALKPNEFESFLQKTESSNKNEPSRDPVMVSCVQGASPEGSANPYERRTKQKEFAPPKRSSSKRDDISMLVNMLPYDISMLKKNRTVEEPANSLGNSGKKKKTCPDGVKSQFSFSAMPAKTEETSFIGFKSVFSFL